MQKDVFSGLKLDNGEPIYTQEYIQSLRDADKKHPDKLKGGRPNMAQAGGKNPEKAGEAIEAAAGILEGQIH